MAASMQCEQGNWTWNRGSVEGPEVGNVSGAEDEEEGDNESGKFEAVQDGKTGKKESAEDPIDSTFFVESSIWRKARQFSSVKRVLFR